MSNCRFKLNHIFSFLFCVVIFSFFSCERESEKTVKYTVDDRLEPYLERFLEEGKKRGTLVDIEEEGGLILEFADLTPPTIGVYYSSSKPVHVQIDRTYWRETNQSPNRENLREEVVFHELGHGFLGRGHKNDVLQNDEWKSMMCGEPQINGRSWCLNFNGYRKVYYLDELFDSQTAIPEWSKPAVFDGDKGTLLYSEDYAFSDPQVQSNETFKFEIKDGVYRISSSVSQNQLLALFHNVPLPADFYMEMEMTASFILKEGDISGIFAGNSTSSNYFTVASDNRSFASNNKCIVPFAEVMIGDKYQRESYNRLAVSKRGDELFFYINDKLVYRNDYQIPSYSAFGVIVPAKGSVSIKNFSVYTSGEDAVLRAAKQIANPVILGEVAVSGSKFLK